MDEDMNKPVYIKCQKDVIEKVNSEKKALTFFMFLLAAFITVTTVIFLSLFMTNVKADYNIIKEKFHNGLEIIEKRIWNAESYAIENQHKNDEPKFIIDFSNLEKIPLPEEKENIPTKDIMNLFTKLQQNIENENFKKNEIINENVKNEQLPEIPNFFNIFKIQDSENIFDKDDATKIEDPFQGFTLKLISSIKSDIEDPNYFEKEHENELESNKNDKFDETGDFLNLLEKMFNDDDYSETWNGFETA